jgi:hypothetical protein
MLRLHRAMALLAAAITAAACATTMNVSSHVERGLDVSRYTSFDWGPADALPTGDPRLDADPFFKDHFEGAVERQLAARGLALATSGTPDLLIHYHANIRPRLDIDRTDRDWPPGTVAFEAGTLVLDVMDARTNRLVWRGWAQCRIDSMLQDRNRMARTIDQAVTRMVARFPQR